ncbi:DNA-binding protein [Thermosipho melanesiensis]|uniref:Iron dependent repressor n=2 Tax=Thermosipho melanesiensis TaxID=46541 RepID=A6LNW8_THEM4|nr:metal-dependent transcriptional regulator [Thermosipho melanesiensis]ABR31619.1 iron dependent repressor [Thermosipho melanesiensis BI429]APT74648.1 DNA-binding protein [Thermosipho melanesiensis]OOC35147.1 DNA-binding protein [Thermosipho melanesiensis]OOC35357.1 DNA-binding protein [Thermosipho melanesiensis]OOC36608.1 DNA-binding protein [Thermosipho melanesiensis]
MEGNLNLTKAERKYLLVVFLTLNSMGWTRLKKVSDYANVKMPSAKQALNSLAQKGLVYYEKRGAITLTEEGKKIALRENKNIQAFKNFLIDFLKIAPEKAHKSCMKIYFDLDDEVAEKFVMFSKFMNECPQEKPLFLKHFDEFLKNNRIVSKCPFMNLEDDKDGD